jgi:hypothetical protein
VISNVFGTMKKEFNIASDGIQSLGKRTSVDSSFISPEPTKKKR